MSRLLLRRRLRPLLFGINIINRPVVWRGSGIGSAWVAARPLWCGVVRVWVCLGCGVVLGVMVASSSHQHRHLVPFLCQLPQEPGLSGTRGRAGRRVLGVPRPYPLHPIGSKTTPTCLTAGMPKQETLRRCKGQPEDGRSEASSQELEEGPKEAHANPCLACWFVFVRWRSWLTLSFFDGVRSFAASQRLYKVH